jgi:hypothetical protein
MRLSESVGYPWILALAVGILAECELLAGHVTQAHNRLSQLGERYDILRTPGQEFLYVLPPLRARADLG